MVTKYSGTTVGDLLVHEESAIRCREITQVTNPSADDFEVVVGTPIKAGGVVIIGGEESSVIGLLLEAFPLAGNETTGASYPYIARDAAVNRDKIATHGPDGHPYDVAAIAAALEGLGIISRREPTKSTTQTN